MFGARPAEKGDGRRIRRVAITWGPLVVRIWQASRNLKSPDGSACRWVR